MPIDRTAAEGRMLKELQFAALLLCQAIAHPTA
jgi:hypothetical protein